MAREPGIGARRMDLLLDIAAKQRGLLTRAQLLDAGLSRHFIDGRLKCGLLRSVHAGVYQLGPVCASRARERAALLACNGGVISHGSAATLWQMLPDQPKHHPVNVLLCAQRHWGVRPGIRVHRGVPGNDEITAIDDVPVTTPARTLLDIASMSARDLERALGAAERLEPSLRHQLTTLLARYPERRGTGALHVLVAITLSGTFTRSEAEEKLLALVRAAGLPTPETNVVLHGYEVDFLWRDEQLVVEVDGFEFHSSHRAFVRDRRRDSVIIAAGMRVFD